MLQMLTQQKTACDAMLDEENKLITEYQAVCTADFTVHMYHTQLCTLLRQMYANVYNLCWVF